LELILDQVNPAAGDFMSLTTVKQDLPAKAIQQFHWNFILKNPVDFFQNFPENFFQIFFGNIWPVQKHFVSLQCLQKRTGK